MKMLIITQKVDKNDGALGFFCGWLDKLAKKIDKIYVLALGSRNIDLAENIKLYSLGKENGNNRLRRFVKFNQFLINLCLNKKIDIIFIHMCPEYAILTWPYAKLRNIPIVMWYAHGNVNMRLRITCFLVNRIVSSSQEGFRINSKRLTIAGQGIDVEKFKPRAPNSKPKNGKKIILSVGRISPVKNYETLIRALDILVNQWDARYLELQIVGDVPRKSQNKYLYFLKNLIGRYKLEDYVKFSGPISYTQIENYYQNCELFISTSNTGSLDKVVLEAMACGKIVLTSNEAFNNLLEAYSYILKFDKNDAYGLAEKIVYILEMNTQDRDALAYNLREIVVQKHSLGRLIGKLVGIFQNLI